MIQYRPFRNTDPPQLVEVWRSQVAGRGLMQPMSVALLERYVLSKPTFDREGLVVAVEDEKLLGFAHAGLGPAADESTLSTEAGVVSMVMLRPDVDHGVAGQLLVEAENYLRRRGAKQLFGGGNEPLCPFYFGLYGGSEYSGVLDSHPEMQAIFREHGFTEVRRSIVFHRDLGRFRPVVDRQQMQVRRHNTFEAQADPPTTTWWNSVLFEPFDRTRYYLLPRDGSAPVASVNFWSMETFVGAWGVHAVGVAGLLVPSTRRRGGLAKYLLGEAFRQLNAGGVALAEVHVASDNEAALTLFRGLGFEQVDQSAFYRKD